MTAIALQQQRYQSAPILARSKPANGLRVAVVSDAISGRNGVGTYYTDLISLIRPHVGDAQLIAPQSEPEWSTEFFALPMPGDPTQRLAWPRRTTLYSKLDEMQPHVVILPSLGPFSFYALLYARKRNLPLAIVNHTDFDHLLSLYWSNWVAWPTRQGLRALTWWLYRQAAAVGTMNVEALHQAERAGARLARVMATPLDMEFLTEPTRPMPDHINKAIFVGRLAQEKGVGDVLRAVRALPHVQFTIAGDGPLKESVQRTASECGNLTYLGWLPRKRVREEIDAAEILLLPSAHETFGTVALEALARRRFVVASSECGISKWPSIAEGIFQTSAETALSAVISEIQKMPAGQRNRYAEKSWQAIPAFNDHVIRTWLEFLVAAAGSDDRASPSIGEALEVCPQRQLDWRTAFSSSSSSHWTH